MTAFEPIAEQMEVVRKRLRPHKLFLLIAPLLYLAYALITPPFQTPDEQQHLFRAWQLSELQLVGERRGDVAGGVLPDSLGRAALPEIGSLKPHVDRAVVQRSFSDSFTRATPLQTHQAPRFYDFRGGVLYSPAGYVPQVTAIWIGESMDLSIENILRLGRLLNAALAIFLMYWALRITPVGSAAILFVALFPMTVAASASFGQDGLVIGGSCLLTAVGLRNALSRREQISNLAISAAVTMPIALCKIFYLPLALIGGQPFVKGRIRASRMWPWIAIAGLSALLAIVWLHENAGVVVSPWSGIPRTGERLAGALRHPLQFPTILEHTYVGHGPALLDSLFEFGWLNVPAGAAAAFLAVIACGLVLIAGDPAASRLGWPTRLWLLLLVLVAALLISLAAWLYGTPARMDWIFGLQGRYFIPLAPSLLIAVLPGRKSPSSFARFVPLLMIGSNLFVLAAIARAFYRF